MTEVKFYKEVDDKLLKYAVIVSKSDNKWVFCKHKERNTYECPGGHREKNENILDTAKRELWEETGAVDYSMIPICIYSVIKNNNAETESFGMLYYAEIKTFEKLPELEIEEIKLFDEIPENLTYPLIQPKLMRKIMKLNPCLKNADNKITLKTSCNK